MSEEVKNTNKKLIGCCAICLFIVIASIFTRSWFTVVAVSFCFIACVINYICFRKRVKKEEGQK